jgi:hypothetical protein
MPPTAAAPRRAAIVTGSVFALLVIALHSFPLAQQPPPTFRTGVEAVVLDVSVLGRDGLPVRGLSAADFTVLEDGRAQKIDTFTAVDLPDVVRTGATWLRDAPRETRANTELNEGAILVLVLDDMVMSRQGALHAPIYARQVIDGLGPNDLAAVVYMVC